MPKFEFCLPMPTLGKAVPAGPQWFHEIKYDGYRLRVERDGDRVQLITRGGYDWTKRFPWIVEAALKNRNRQFVIDGEAVVLGIDGVADFNALHSRKHDDEVQLDAFDILALDGTTCATYRECRSNDVSIIVRSILERTIRSEKRSDRAAFPGHSRDVRFSLTNGRRQRGW